MKTFIVYDSLFGNTKKIAQTISNAIPGSTSLLNVNNSGTPVLSVGDVLIVGSPVHGGMPTPGINMFIKNLKPSAVKGVRVAAFDTRFAIEKHGFGLKLLMTIIRFASERILKDLVKKGGTKIVEPMGFIVKDKKGPLEDGEITRAKDWARQIVKEAKIA